MADHGRRALRDVALAPDAVGRRSPPAEAKRELERLARDDHIRLLLEMFDVPWTRPRRGSDGHVRQTEVTAGTAPQGGADRERAHVERHHDVGVDPLHSGPKVDVEYLQAEGHRRLARMVRRSAAAGCP